MKILYLINALPKVGPVNVLESIIRGLDREVYKPHILVLRSEDTQGNDSIFRLLEVDITYLHLSLWTLELRTKSVAFQIKQYAQTIGADIIHLHGYHPDLLGNYLSDRYPTVSTQHNIAVEDFRYSKGYLVGSYMSYRLWHALSDKVTLVGISERVSTYCRQSSPRSYTKTIYNGVSTTRFRLHSPEECKSLRLRLLPELPSGAEIWLVLGSLCSRKDPMTIIRAFVQLLSVGALSDESYLIFLGDGPLRTQCEQTLGDLMAERVRFLGFQPNAEEFLATADYLISASHSEGFGLNVIEAILSGVVPIVSNIAAHRELLRGLPRYEALTFSPLDTLGLGRSILAAKGMKMQLSERELVAHRFSEESMATQYMLLYKELYQ